MKSKPKEPVQTADDVKKAVADTLMHHEKGEHGVEAIIRWHQDKCARHADKARGLKGITKERAMHLLKCDFHSSFWKVLADQQNCLSHICGRRRDSANEP